MTVSDKVVEIFKTIETIKKNCNLDKEIVVMAAVKQRKVSEIYQAFESGIRFFGENRIQEAEKHLSEIKAETRAATRWHFIGRLQSNKVKKAVKLFDSIDCVDSFKLVKEIDKASLNLGTVKDIMIEINMGEEQKGGIKIQEINSFLNFFFEFKNVRLTGLMSVPPFFEDPEKSRPYFRKMFSCFGEIKKKHPEPHLFKFLSMGMSNDYKVAIEEGSNMVRLGTAIFGERS